MKTILNSVFRILSKVVIFFIIIIVSLNLGNLLAQILFKGILYLNLVEPLNKLFSKIIL